MNDVASRIKTCVQLTTDGHKVYVNAVKEAFGADVVEKAVLTEPLAHSPQWQGVCQSSRGPVQGNFSPLVRAPVIGANSRDIVGCSAITKADRIATTTTAAHNESGEFLQIN